MGRLLDARVALWGLKPLAVLPPINSADESDALQTLRDTVRAPRARQRLECVRLSAPLSSAAAPFGSSRTHGEPTENDPQSVSRALRHRGA